MRAPGVGRMMTQQSVLTESPAASTSVSASESERSSCSSLLDRLRSPTVSALHAVFAQRGNAPYAYAELHAQ